MSECPRIDGATVRIFHPVRKNFSESCTVEIMLLDLGILFFNQITTANNITHKIQIPFCGCSRIVRSILLAAALFNKS